MDEVEDQASDGEERLREDPYSHQVDNSNNQTPHIQAQFSKLSLTEAKENIITEDGHPDPLLATNPHASTEDKTPQTPST